jgi:hypothetical protein
MTGSVRWSVYVAGEIVDVVSAPGWYEARALAATRLGVPNDRIHVAQRCAVVVREPDGRFRVQRRTGSPWTFVEVDQLDPAEGAHAMVIRWKRFYANGSRTDYERHEPRAAGHYPTVALAFWVPGQGYAGDWTACEACGCVEEAGGHHRTGCPHAHAHRQWCARCRHTPPRLPAERVV